MFRVDNLIEMCDVINAASTRLSQLLGQEVKLRILHPEVKGFYFMEPLPKRFYEDTLVRKIIDVVCDEYQITMEQLRSKNRLRKLVDARKMVSWFMKNLSEHTDNTVIGEVLNLHRTSVIHMLSCAEDLIKSDKVFYGRHVSIMDKLELELEENKI